MNRSPIIVAALAGFAATPALAQDDLIPAPELVHSTVPAGSLTGTAALRAMGDDLERIAQEHNTTPVELAEWFRTDKSLYLTPSGMLLNVCPAAPGQFEQGDEQAEREVLARIFDEEIDIEDFMNLESRPGSNRTIYMDVDGHFSSGNSWGHSINFPPYNTQGSSATFTDQEKSDIIEHWKEVAEDFAPFDVNVTTKDPGLAAILRSNGGDQQYGIRALLTQATNGFGNGIGGVAFLNSFGSSIDNLCFNFNKGLGSGPMTVSHEVGHTLGLRHDGLNGSEYHPGSSGTVPTWGPIMGAPFGRQIVQWSNGDYPGASRGENDIGIIDNNLDLLPDDHVDGVITGTPLPLDTPVDGVIGSRTDVDSFLFTVPADGTYEISVINALRGPNLDASFILYRTSPFSIVGTTDPDLTADAIEEYALTAGDYVIAIDGSFETKNRGPVSDYGSIGGFQVQVTEVIPPQPLAITFPNGLPTDLTEGETTTITVDINPGDDGPINQATAFLFYGFDVVGQPFLPVQLVNTSGFTYTAELPAGVCSQTASFYVSITNEDLVTFNSPVDPTMPYTAEVTDCDTGDCLADTNGDGLVSPADFNAWILAFNAQSPACDQNGDGQCTPADFNAWILNFNAGC